MLANEINHRKLLVVDVEATCNNNSEFPRSEMEIIEIGANILDIDNGFSIIDSFALLIKPSLHPSLTDFCSDLTSITQHQIDHADGFTKSYNQFLKWMNCHQNICAWGSWGQFDKSQISSDCKRHGITKNLSTLTHINILDIYRSENNVISKDLYRAIQSCRLLYIGTRHRASDDVSNITMIVQNDKNLKTKIMESLKPVK